MIRTVVHFSDSTVFGGTERAILHLVEGLDRTRWRAVVLHDGDAPEELVSGARAAGVDTRVARRVRGKFHPLAFGHLVAELTRHRASVLHAHLQWPLACKYGIAAAAAARVPAIVATSQLHLDLPRGGFVDVQHRLLTRRIDRYIAVSRHVADGLEQRYRVPSEKITIIPNAVNLFAHEEVSAARPPAWPGRAGRPVALVLARLEQEKAVDVAIDAATRLPEIDLVIAGAGTLRGALEAQVRALGLEDRVFFLGHRIDAPALLRQAAVFVLPSRREGLPLSVLEARAAGVPVVATDIGGTREAIQHEETGLLVPVDDAGALAAGIQRVLGDPTASASRAMAAQTRVRREFTTETIVRQVAAVYDAVLADRAP